MSITRIRKDCELPEAHKDYLPDGREGGFESLGKMTLGIQLVSLLPITGRNLTCIADNRYYCVDFMCLCLL